jgi:hypothetical protein
MYFIRLIAALLAVLGVAAPGPALADGPVAMAGVLKVYAPDKGTVTLTLPSPFGDKALSVADPDAKARLAKAQAGDLIKFGADDSAAPSRISTLQGVFRPIGKLPRVAALAGAFAVIAALAAIMLWRSPLAFLIGVDNRYSNSQTQLAAWFGAVATVYLATVVLRLACLGADYIGGVGITENLLGLTGLSALSFGGAKVITTRKIQSTPEANQPAVKAAARRPDLLRDLVQNDMQQPDLGDFQMILIAGAAVIVFVMSSFHFLGELELAQQVTLPDIDSTLLASFGIGQGAYLVKKAASKLGEG